MAVVGILSGCQDLASDPVAVVGNEATMESLSLPADLPALPGLVGATGLDGALGEAVVEWETSWSLPAEEGRGARAAAYRAALGPLGEAIRTHQIRRAAERLERGVSAARSLDPDLLSEEITARVEGAERRSREVPEALETGDHREALRLVLEGADLLREAGPEATARVLLQRAEEARQDPGRVRDLSAQDLDRVDRLLRKSREALENGDPSQAVPRAFYANQLLDVDLP